MDEFDGLGGQVFVQQFAVQTVDFERGEILEWDAADVGDEVEVDDAEVAFLGRHFPVADDDLLVPPEQPVAYGQRLRCGLGGRHDFRLCFGNHFAESGFGVGLGAVVGLRVPVAYSLFVLADFRVELPDVVSSLPHVSLHWAPRNVDSGSGATSPRESHVNEKRVTVSAIPFAHGVEHAGSHVGRSDGRGQTNTGINVP